MRNRLFYILTAFLFAVTGCNSGAQEQASHSDCMDFPEQVSRNWEILTNSETIIPKPVGIVCDSNSIDVLGLFSEKWVHKYDISTGAETGDIIIAGQGPKDCINAVSIRLTDNGRSIDLYDYVARKIKKYGLDGNFNSEQSFPDELKGIWNAWSLSENRALLAYPQKKDSEYRRTFVIIEGDSIVGQYDMLTQELQANPEMTLYLQSTYSLAPDGKHLAYATVQGGVLEFFSIDSNSIALTFSKIVFPVEYEDDGNNRKLKNGYPIGFTSICATDSLVYAPYSGTKNEKEATKIGVWKWDGKPVKRIDTDAMILKLTVNDDKITAVVLKNDEIFLASLQL